MRSRALLMLTAIGLSATLVACGSSDAGKQTGTPSTGIPSATQLEARLLDVGDVGAGWKLGQPITPEDLSSVSQSIPCTGVTIDPSVAKRLTAVTGRQLEPADRSAKHMIELVITGTSRQLDADLQTLARAMDSCSVKTGTSQGTSTLTVKKLAVPKLGDQQAAYVMTDSADSAGAFYVRNAFVRVGTVAVAFGLMEVVAAPQDKPQVSDDTFVKILRTALERISG
jgi:hypothetical protein